MLNFKLTILLGMTAAAAALAGCSVRSSHVVNEPPPVNMPVVTFANEKGIMRAETATVFLWPANWTEEQARQGVKTMNVTSRQYEALAMEMMAIPVKIEGYFKAFVATGCTTTFAKTQQEYEEGDAVEFVDATGLTAEQQQVLQACVVNQAARGAMKERAMKIATVEQPVLLKRLAETLDSDLTKIENSKVCDAHGSSIAMSRNDDGTLKVEVKLKNLLGSGKTQSTEKGPGKITDAAYDTVNRRLTFNAPIIDKAGKETGEIYHFDLVRIPNMFETTQPDEDENGNPIQVTVEYARFKGEIRVLVNGQQTRSGSAQFTGFWK